MKRFWPSPLLSLVMWCLWLLLANDFSAGQMVLGVFFAWLIPVLTQPFWLSRPRIHKPWKLLSFQSRCGEAGAGFTIKVASGFCRSAAGYP